MGMTIQEAKQMFIKRGMVDVDGNPMFSPQAWREAFLVVDEYLRKDEWIPVTDHLPHPNEVEGNVRKYYLVQNEYGDMMVAYYDGTHWNQIYHTGYIKEEIVAWRELPEKYHDSISEEVSR